MDRIIQAKAYTLRFGSVADVALYVYPRLCPEGGYDLEGLPAVRAWLERTASLPGFVPPPG